MTQMLFETPGTVARLGEAVFVKLPLYRSAQPARAVYIHPGLYAEYFGGVASWETMAQVVQETFSVSLQPAASAEPVGWAYVDRQFDPDYGSLAGNAGSGRAYYCGPCFNIKGEKTPLAQSSHVRFSDGNLEMERGIWESMLANILAEEMQVGTPPVLAILDLQEDCNVVWREVPVRRVKIIRIDRDGALDRLSHLVQNPRALPRDALVQAATRFGVLEAEKYLHRITHGAWSTGNISLQGHLIDFDTVAAVKGRHPQHSSSMWYPDNYFGYEWMGQEKMLQLLAAHPAINEDRVPAAELTAQRDASYAQHLAQQLPYFMGLPTSAERWSVYGEAITALAQSFSELAPLLYPKLHPLHGTHGASNFPHLFDISCFMRHYPMLKRAGEFTAERALQLMTETTLLDAPWTATAPPDINPEAEPYWNALLARFEPVIVRTPEQQAAWTRQAEQFVRDYDAVCAQLVAGEGWDWAEIEARAYVINEDRLYWLPAFTPSFILACLARTRPPAEIHRRLLQMMQACRRAPQRDAAGHYRSGGQLFAQGLFDWRLDGQGGCFPCMEFLLDSLPELETATRAEDFTFTIEGLSVAGQTLLRGEGTLTVRGERQPTARLLAHGAREKPLMFYETLIQYSSEWLNLTDYLEIPISS